MEEGKEPQRDFSDASHMPHMAHMPPQTIRSHAARVQTPFPTDFLSEGETSFFCVLVLTNSASSGAFAKMSENAEQNSSSSARTRVYSLDRAGTL